MKQFCIFSIGIVESCARLHKRRRKPVQPNENIDGLCIEPFQDPTLRTSYRSLSDLNLCEFATHLTHLLRQFK